MLPGRFVPLILAALALASPALAQAPEVRAPAEDRAAADALFTEAAKLAHEGRWPEACAKLEAIDRLDPGGVGAWIHLSNCYEHIGRIASAWTAANEAGG